MATQFRIESSAIPASTTVVGFRLREALSEPFSLEVALRVTSGTIDMQTAVGEAVHFESGRTGLGQEPQVYNGIIAAIELVHEATDIAYWRAIVVPKLWRLGLAYHSRVFTVGTVPEIIEAVLLDEGLTSRDFRFALNGSYPSLEHVAMYRESSLAFISRLCEREGISYYFEHEGDRHRMVLVDDLGGHPEARGAVRMIPYADDDVLSDEGFFEFSYEMRALPGQVRVTDYDYLRPSIEIGAGATIQNRPTGVVVEHGEFVPLPDEERRYAEIRAEEILCREQWFKGWGRVQGLRTGFTFPVSGHELSRLDDEYLAVEIEAEGFELEASQGEEAAQLARLFELEGKRGVVVNVGAIPKATQFRPTRVTPWPRIHGVVDGVVDGMASSDYAQVDAQGRYKVRLRFDESDLLDGQASTWVRMLQPHGGSVEGMHFPLRKQTEVQVAFLGGDPDRPVIVAAAPNAVESSKVVRSNHTQNVIHTGGDNTITMEDQAGAMFIRNFSPPDASTLHMGAGPNQFELRTDGQGHQHIGMNLDVDVFGAKIETVQQTVRETYIGVQHLIVDGFVQRTMKTSLDQTIQGPVTDHITGAFTETVTNAVTETYNNGQKTTVTAGVKQTFNSTLTQTVNGGQLEETISSNRKRDVTGTFTHDVSAHVDETFGATRREITGDYTEDVGASYTIKAPSLEIVCVERTWIDATIDTMESNRMIVDQLKKRTVGKISLSATGVSLGAIGVDVKTVKTAISATGVKLGATGLNVKTGITIRDRGLLLRTMGVDIGFKAIYIIL